MTGISGQVDEGWGRVADAFARNFEQGLETGAACSVYLDGRQVVDLWGGSADARTGRPWEQDTIALVFSTTKGATALCVNMLAERGDLDLDAPVAMYWPEFAAAGKEKIPVRYLLTHQAGLPLIDAPLTLEDACGWEPVIRALEAQAPLWPPGTEHGYHALTFGYLLGEVVRRVSGKTLGRYFADEVARPLGLSAWIGLPEAAEPRVAPLELELASDQTVELLEESFERLGLGRDDAREAASALHAAADDPDSVLVRSATLGGAFPELLTETGGHNARIVRAAELPGSNMVTDARSLARMYSATFEEVDGCRLLAPKTVEDIFALQPAESVAFGSPEVLAGFFPRFSLGFQLPSRLIPLLGPRSFGHGGAGGSLGLAAPDLGVGFGYVMNRMATDLYRRSSALLDAVTASAG